MKLRVFFVIFFLACSLYLRSQCLISGLSPTYCLNSPSSSLVTSPLGGQLNGSGLSNGTFIPSLAGVGVHTLSYVNCSATFSMEADAFAAYPYTPNYVWFGDNDVTSALPIGFPFRYFCNTFDSIYISANGFFTFTPPSSSGCCQGLSLPNVNAPTNMIAFSWTDLDPSQGGTVRYCTVGSAPNRTLVVSFNCVFHKTGNGPVTSEVYLHESSNLIEISTVTKPIPTGTVSYNTTMGITGPNGQAYVVPGRNGNANWTATNELYRFTPGPYCEVTQTTTVFPVPSVTAAVSRTLLCKGEPLTLSAGGAQTYSWSSGQSGSVVTDFPLSNTLYTVTALDQNMCAATASVFASVSTCEGIAEGTTADEALLVLYPNPSSGTVHLKTMGTRDIVLFDASGRQLKHLLLRSENNFQVTLDDLCTGVYFVRDQSGSFTQRLVVIVP